MLCPLLLLLAMQRLWRGEIPVLGPDRPALGLDRTLRRRRPGFILTFSLTFAFCFSFSLAVGFGVVRNVTRGVVQTRGSGERGHGERYRPCRDIRIWSV
jgi:hypothetical protein